MFEHFAASRPFEDPYGAALVAPLAGLAVVGIDALVLAPGRYSVAQHALSIILCVVLAAPLAYAITFLLAIPAVMLWTRLFGRIGLIAVLMLGAVLNPAGLILLAVVVGFPGRSADAFHDVAGWLPHTHARLLLCPPGLATAATFWWLARRPTRTAGCSFHVEHDA